MIINTDVIEKVNAQFRLLISQIEDREAKIERLRKALHAARRAIGDHFAPNDCYATGPITGDPFHDLVECPACSFLAIYAALNPQPEDTK